jgi:hypothetical protein
MRAWRATMEDVPAQARCRICWPAAFTSRLGRRSGTTSTACRLLDPFHPHLCGVYNDFVRLLEIASQSCVRRFRVVSAVSRSWHTLRDGTGRRRCPRRATAVAASGTATRRRTRTRWAGVPAAGRRIAGGRPAALPGGRADRGLGGAMAIAMAPPDGSLRVRRHQGQDLAPREHDVTWLSGCFTDTLPIVCSVQ